MGQRLREQFGGYLLAVCMKAARLAEFAQRHFFTLTPLQVRRDWLKCLKMNVRQDRYPVMMIWIV